MRRLTTLRWLAVVLPWCLLALPGTAQEAALSGRIEERDGQRVLYLWGSEEDRGRAEGYLLAEEILEAFDDYYLAPRFLPIPAAWDQRVTPLVEARVRSSDATRARVRGLIAGMKERRGVDGIVLERLRRPLRESDLLVSLALPDLMMGACSSFAVAAELLEEGEGPIVGRNLDYLSSDRMLAAAVIRVEQGVDSSPGYVSFGFAGFAGTLTALSAAGTFVAIHDVPVLLQPAGPFTPRVEALTQLMRDHAAADDPRAAALAHLRAQALCCGGNFLFAWHRPERSGAVVFEVGPQESVDGGVTERGFEGAPFVVCTNHHRSRTAAIDCHRFTTLEGGCLDVASFEADPLTVDSAWELLGRASVRATIHRCVADLEHGLVRYQRRLKPGGDLGMAATFRVAELISAARPAVQPGAR